MLSGSCSIQKNSAVHHLGIAKGQKEVKASCIMYSIKMPKTLLLCLYEIKD